MSSCLSCWQRRHRSTINNRMSHQGRFVSPDDLEASIFSERGVASSPKVYENSKTGQFLPQSQASQPRGNNGTDYSNFSLTVDMGTYDKFKSMEQISKNTVLGSETDLSPPKKRPGHNLVRRCFPPVGLSLVFANPLDINSASGHSIKKGILDQIRFDISAALNVPEDRIRMISIDKSNLIVNMNILGDLGGDPRSPMQLACDLVMQSRDAASLLRNSSSTNICSDALIREKAFPVPQASKSDKLRKSTGPKRTVNAAGTSSDAQSSVSCEQGVDSLSNDRQPASSSKEDEFSMGPSEPPRGPSHLALRVASRGDSDSSASALQASSESPHLDNSQDPSAPTPPPLLQAASGRTSSAQRAHATESSGAEVSRDAVPEMSERFLLDESGQASGRDGALQGLQRGSSSLRLKEGLPAPLAEAETMADATSTSLIDNRKQLLGNVVLSNLYGASLTDLPVDKGDSEKQKNLSIRSPKDQTSNGRVRNDFVVTFLSAVSEKTGDAACIAGVPPTGKSASSVDLKRDVQASNIASETPRMNAVQQLTGFQVSPPKAKDADTYSRLPDSESGQGWTEVREGTSWLKTRFISEASVQSSAQQSSNLDLASPRKPTDIRLHDIAPWAPRPLSGSEAPPLSSLLTGQRDQNPPMASPRPINPLLSPRPQRLTVADLVIRPQDSQILSPRLASWSELPTSAKPPRPPIPTARLGQFPNAVLSGSSSPSISPPMPAPKMSLINISGPSKDVQDLYSGHQDKPDGNALERKQSRAPTGNENTGLFPQMRELIQSTTTGLGLNIGQDRQDRSQEDQNLHTPRLSEHGVKDRQREYQEENAATQWFSPAVIPRLPNGLESEKPDFDLSRFKEERHNGLESEKPDSVLSRFKEDRQSSGTQNWAENSAEISEKSTEYIGPTNPFFSGQAPPRRLSRQRDQGDISTSAFHQARLAIAQAAGEARHQSSVNNGAYGGTSRQIKPQVPTSSPETFEPVQKRREQLMIPRYPSEAINYESVNSSRSSYARSHGHPSPSQGKALSSREEGFI